MLGKPFSGRTLSEAAEQTICAGSTFPNPPAGFRLRRWKPA
jgi:hypothetical protein